MKMKLHRFVVLCILLVFVPAVTGCSEKETVRTLSEAELMEANQAFSDPEMCCFFTCYYEEPQEINLNAFLRYCPVGVMLEDADTEEFLAWKEAAKVPDTEAKFQKPSTFYVPVRRLANTDVSAILTKYAGITTANIKNIGDVVYLEEYDAFYNFTSDFAPGHFESVGGTMEGSIVRLWSENVEDGTRTVLTLERAGETYLIRSFAQECAD